MGTPKSLYRLTISSPDALCVIKRVGIAAFLTVADKVELGYEPMKVGGRQLQKIAVGEASDEVFGILTGDII